MTTVAQRPTARASPHACTELTLLDRFGVVCDGTAVELPPAAQRLAAFLAIQRRPLLRSYVAGALWPDTQEERAHANLRSTLWRLQRCDRSLVVANGQELRLRDDVDVDHRRVETLARKAVGGAADALEVRPEALAGDLLPDWYEDWILIEREHFRQLRLRALDALCERSTLAGRLGDALEFGLAALAGEPLRESAHRALIRVHLAEGNPSEAVRQYDLCRRLLGEHLGVEPSQHMTELMLGVTAAQTSA